MSKKSNPADKKVYLYWQAETIRLHESEQEPMDDGHMQNLLNQKYQTFDQRVLYRADMLARQNRINFDLKNYLTSAKISIIIICLIAFISGAGIAASALAQPQVNLASALIALLGLHVISFIIWLASYLSIIRPSNGLSAVWLWLNQKLGHKNSLAGRAFVSLFMRHKLWPATIGIITNTTWLSLFTGALISMLIMLSTRNYNFYWASTLLSLDSFGTFSQIIGALPAALGFPLPDETSISASMSTGAILRTANTQWSIWLIGCIFVWGLLPRLFALLLCAINLRRGFKRLKIDTSLAGWLDLSEKYGAHKKHIGIDKPAGKINNIFKPAFNLKTNTSRLAIMGHELAPNTPWPPTELANKVYDLGTSSSRQEQKQIRAALESGSFNLLIVCNTDLTPDRGTFIWFLELQNLVTDLKIYCPKGTRIKLWQQEIARHSLVMVDSLQQWQAELSSQANK